MRSFAARVIAWQRRHGRNDLPWQGRDPYRVWLSEIMLQQTRVGAVLRYYERFLARFPDLATLAGAPLGEVMRLWAGLGYYSRARNLHACAREVQHNHGGVFPRSAAALVELPGIGRSTAAAIAAFCYEERVPILDGNVKRVLVRHLALDGNPAARAAEHLLWRHAEARLPPARDMAAYTQGVMDLGATVCTRAAPDCAACPVRADCRARLQGRQGDLPARRARKTPPTRRARFLLVVAGGAILLERQPAPGIWGGLLAPPQFASAPALHRAAALLAPGTTLRRLAVRRHGFTHFTLVFTPYLALSARAPRGVDDPVRVWLRLDEIATAALPAPMRALLGEVRDGLAGRPARSRSRPSVAAAAMPGGARRRR